MKNSSQKRNFRDNSLRIVKEGSEKLPKPNNFSSKAVKTTMTEQLIVPPARVWDKIEQILDEQDNRRNTANQIIASSFNRKSIFSEKKLYLATAAGLGVIAGLVWIVL